jgi:hypothetical protein
VSGEWGNGTEKPGKPTEEAEKTKSTFKWTIYVN